MNRRPHRWAGVALLLWAGEGFAVQSTITEAEGYACMGDERSRKETEQAALANAKRNAGEHATTLIETKTEVEDLQLKKDLISAFSKAQVKLVKELERAWYEEPGAGDCMRVKIQAEVIPDTVGFELGSNGPSTPTSQAPIGDVSNTPRAAAETPCPQPTHTFPPSPVPPLFQDDFDNGIGDGWIREGGDFNMANGRLSNPGRRGILWLGNRNWTDVVINFDVGGVGCGNNYVGIPLRMQDASNYIEVVIATGGCVFATGGIVMIRNGEQQRVMVTKQGSRGHWRIEAVGRVYKVFVNGRLLMSASDETLTFTRGSVGINMGSGELDNFTVCKYSP